MLKMQSNARRSALVASFIKVGNGNCPFILMIICLDLQSEQCGDSLDTDTWDFVHNAHKHALQQGFTGIAVQLAVFTQGLQNATHKLKEDVELNENNQS